MGAIEALILQARMLWDGDEAIQGMKDAGTQANSLESTIGGAFKKIGTAIAGALTLDAIKNFGVACIEAGAEVSAETAAYSQIMGDYAEEANAKMQSVADATGMVDSRLTPYMTSMTAKFKGLGYGVDDATDMASRGLTLAADSAAFWDKSLDESMGHLNSFINGSYEGGEAIGLFANDTQMAAYAVETGVVKSTKAWSSLDEATKQATRLEYAENMMKQSGATGQAAKESGSYANVMANLAEKWRQFKAQIGEPLIENVVIPVMKTLSGVLDTVSDRFGDLGEVWREVILPPVDRISRALKWLRVQLGILVPDIDSNVSAWDIFVKAAHFVEDILDKVATGIFKVADILPTVAPLVAGAAAAFAGFKVGSAIQKVVTGFQKAKVAVALFTAGQTNAQIATKLSTGALKLHEIAVGLMTGKITLAQIATGIWTKVQSGLNAVLSANPIGLVVMAIAAIVAALVIAYQKSDTFRAFVDKLWASLKDKLQPVIQSVSNFVTGTLVPAFQRFGDFITTTVVPVLQQFGGWMKEHILNVIQSIANWITGTLVPTFQQWGNFITTQIVPALQQLWAAIQERVQPILQTIVNFITTTVVPGFQKIVGVVQSILTAAAPILEAIKTAFSTAFNVVLTVASTVWNIIKTVISTVLLVIRTLISTVTAAIRGDWSAVWNGIKLMASTVWNGIKTVISTVINGIKTVISNVLSGIRSAWSSVWNAIKSVASTVWSGIRSAVSSAINTVRTTISNVLSGIRTFWSTTWTGIKTKVSTIMSAVKDKVESVIEGVRGVFEGLTSFVSDVFAGNWKSAWEGIKKTFEGLWDNISEFGGNIVTGLWEGIGGKVEWIKEKISGFCSSALDAIKNFFGIKSPSRVMRDQVGKELANGVAVGLDANTKVATKAAQKLGQKIVDTAKKRLDDFKEYNTLSLADETAYWDSIRQRCKEGTRARQEADKMYLESKQELDDKLLAAEEEYRAAIDETVRKVEERSDAILSSFRLFEEWHSGESTNATQLIASLDSQVDALNDWQYEINTLEGRIGETALFEAVQQLGVESLEQVKAINSMTEEQLAEYVRLYEERANIAKQLAKDELADENAQTIQAAYQTFADKCAELGVSIESTTTTMQQTLETAFTAITESVSVSMEGVTDSVTAAMETVPSTLGEHMQSALDAVKNTLNDMKAAFEAFEPKMKMPHFSITGSLDVETGSVPEVTVEWYKKAMDSAMVLKDPTIFGAAGGKLLGGGEAGNEVVSGEAHLIGLINAAVAQNNAEMLNVLAKILAVLRNIDESMYDRIVDALTDGVRFKMDGREFGRLVRTYA